MVAMYKPELPLDVLLWGDGFWCFRFEYSADFLRSGEYRLVKTDEPEWLEVTDFPNRRWIDPKTLH